MAAGRRPARRARARAPAALTDGRDDENRGTDCRLTWGNPRRIYGANHIVLGEGIVTSELGHAPADEWPTGKRGDGNPGGGDYEPGWIREHQHGSVADREAGQPTPRSPSLRGTVEHPPGASSIAYGLRSLATGPAAGTEM